MALPNANWPAIVSALGAALAQSAPDERVEVLDRIATRLAPPLYPGFIQLLCAVGFFGDRDLRALVAETLAEAIATARLPCCPAPAWGGAFARGGALAFNTRSFGPLEFLCAAQWQGLAGGPLDRDKFQAATRNFLHLMAASQRAVTLYAAKLANDLADPLEGGFTHANRTQMWRFIQAWRDGEADAARLLLN